ncbi:MAG: hypothetical protein CUN55_07555 [Phototrophicales bacterium]|nr:MAG: hypothetical protein CUN55_07555 [Phototrophicales bacterium]
MHHIIIFLDGIGLGDDDPAINPFAVINAPTLHQLAGGQRWLRSTPYTETERSIFIPTDPRLGVEGRPQSATGQASILTGRNVPAELGRHYGPKPTPQIRAILDENNLFKAIIEANLSATLINPYPPQFFEVIQRGKRLPSSIQHAVLSANISLKTVEDYYQGEAISPDWTGIGWTTFLGYQDAPVYTPQEAGQRLAKLAQKYNLTFFSTWITDEIGHRGPFEDGVAYMQTFDGVMEGLLNEWDDDNGLIIITSDHGNLEQQGDRRHTENDVPTIIIGKERHRFAEGFSKLTDITPNLLRIMGLAD